MMSPEEIAQIARTADKGMYGGAGTVLFGLFTVNDIAAILGALAAVVGAAVSVYCKLAAKRRWEQEHELTMAERRARIAAIHRGEAVAPDQVVEQDE